MMIILHLSSVLSFQVSYYFNVYCALSGLCIVLALVATPSAQLAGSFSRRRLHDQLVSSVMCNSLHFFQSTPFGRIINRFSFDMSIIDKVWFDFVVTAPNTNEWRSHKKQLQSPFGTVTTQKKQSYDCAQFVVSENCDNEPAIPAIYSPVLMCDFN